MDNIWSTSASVNGQTTAVLLDSRDWAEIKTEFTAATREAVASAFAEWHLPRPWITEYRTPTPESTWADSMQRWQKPAIVQPANGDDAVKHLQRSFDPEYDQQGRFFNSFPANRPASDPNEITAEDLLALSMLNVGFTGTPGTVLQSPIADAPRISQLLTKIPVDASITNAADRDLCLRSRSWDAADEECKEPPTDRLWWLLRDMKEMGPVRTSKLMARKRPHLIPIFDTQIAAQFGVKASDSTGQWNPSATSSRTRPLFPTWKNYGRSPNWMIPCCSSASSTWSSGWQEERS